MMATKQERDAINDLTKYIMDQGDDGLVGVIIARLDDRYIKKDDGPNKFITRIEGYAVAAVFTLALTIITLWQELTGKR